MKHLIIRLTLPMLLLTTVISAKAITFEYDGLKFTTTSDNECVVTKSSGVGEVIIPEVAIYDGTEYRVTAIGDEAFLNCINITSVSIPGSVTSIGARAFNGCYMMKAITIPDAVTEIGDYAFAMCSKLIYVAMPKSLVAIGAKAFSSCRKLSSVYIPYSVVTIGDGAFAFCSELKTISLPTSLISIGANAFEQCTGLKSISIPNSVTTIGSYAFSECTGLTSIYLSANLTSIGANIFSGCSALETLELDPENEKYDSRDNCNVIIETATNKLIIGCRHTTIPGTVTSIGDAAFSGCTGLTAIEIPSSVTSIGSSAFSGCTGLTSIEIPNTVTSIGNSLFLGCTGLTTATIPDEITTIGLSAFYNCSALTSVTLPSAITAIEPRAFYHCTSLTSLDIPKSVKSIGYSAFLGSGLTSIDINDVTEIGDKAFEYCTELKSVSILKAKSVSANAFENCIALEKFVLPYEWTSDFKVDFSTLSALNIVYLGEKTPTIPDRAFFKNYNIDDMYSNASTPPTTGYILFGSMGLQGILYVPEGCIDAYKKVSEYCCFKGMQELPYKVVIADEDVSVDILHSVTVTASVAPADATTAPVKWYSLNDDIATVTIDGVVTGVAKGSATLVAICDGITATKKINVTDSNSVKDIATDTPTADTTFDLYNLQGICVATGIDKADITADRFTPGIYILVSSHGSQKVKI